VYCFVYGTLTDPDRAASLLDDWSFVADARVEGLHRVGGRYPTLAPEGSVEGRVLRTDDVARLDEYEGVHAGLYVRVSLPRTDGDGPVEAYVGDPTRLGVDEPVAWPDAGSFEAAVRRYVDEEAVSVRVGEPTDGRRTPV
jgi:gamma-glutamylcyclotransferase (GGCT)/AIG2-like uncharacterized protein YtfP